MADGPRESTSSATARRTLSASHHGDIELLAPMEQLSPQITGPRWFPRAHKIDITSSEPRDVLQSERTFLGFVRFALALLFMAVGLILGFSLRQGSAPAEVSNHSQLFNQVGSYILLVLAFVTVAVATVVYFRAVRRYSQKKIQTHSTSSGLMVFLVGAVVVALGGLNVALIVERFVQT